MTYVIFFVYVHIILLFYYNLYNYCYMQMKKMIVMMFIIYLISISIIDSMNSHVNLLSNVIRNGILLNILDFMCLLYLCICLSRCSRFSLFYLMFHLLLLGDFFAMGTKIVLLLHPYVLIIYT